MTLPPVTLITCTCGRHFAIERIVRFFLDQDYRGDIVLLIYNNSEVSQSLDDIKMPLNRRIYLINNSVDKVSKKPYQNLGAIYRDALSYVPHTTEVVNHMDDDDFYLPGHVSYGVRGYLKAKEKGMLAYKPQFSYFRDVNGVQKASNTLEPSIFVNYDHLQKYQYGLETSAQHLSWILPLGNDRILVDPQGESTFVYTWMGEDGVFKTSGAADNPDNFQNYRSYSQKHGDRIITPISKEEAKQYYQTA